MSTDINSVRSQIGFDFDFPDVPVEDLIHWTHPCYSINNKGQTIGINLSNLSLDAIPAVVARLSDLRILRLLGNKLINLPDWLSTLSNLTHLYLTKNQFVEFPLVVTKLGSLEVLALNSNNIKVVPPSISQLQRLAKLGMSGNGLTSVPFHLKALPSLVSVFLERNRLSEIPDWICELTQLEELRLPYNQLESLPTDIGKLSALRVLSLRQNKITELPDSLFSLASLEDLDLRELPLTDLSEKISDLTCLKSLDLTGTQLKTLPGTLAHLKKLSVMNIGQLKLVEIPPVLFRLSKLQELNLSGTRVRSIPAEVGRLSELTDLDLSGMGLSSVPPALFSLKKLRRLNLIGNRLRELPSQITQSHLEIYSGRSERSEGILLSGNPLESPPIEIVRRGTWAIRTYFKSLKGDMKPIDEVKVLLVGDGGAGKTSLAKRLIGRDFDENEPQTHGINIDDSHILSHGKRIKVHFWDFGGQEMMHATHQFFLSKRSAYILVLDGRKDEKTEYWLKHIEAFGGDSPIIIAVNKIDQNPSFDVNRRFLADKYSSVKDFFRVSCYTGEGIEFLQRALAGTVARIEHTKTMWAASWFNVKERVELMSEDFISYSTFRDLCIEEQISDPNEQEILVEFLHDLGVALRFSDLPLRDTNVINPRWLTEGVYRIVNSQEVANAGGVLDLGMLPRILDQATHPSEKYHFIIELMKKFELCHEISPDSVLLPSLLPIEEPKVSIGSDDFLRFIVDYDFLPKSIMPRFIVRMHSDIYQRQRWRTGVVLSNSAFDSRAVVRADEVDRRIDISVYGSQRREYLGVILHTLRAINESFEKIKFLEKVPMPDRPEVTISYNHLLRLEAKGIRTYMPDGTDKEYEVQDLLGYIKPDRKSEEEILTILRQLKDKSDTEESLMAKANKSFLLQPNFFGLGVNLNELIHLVVRGKRK